MSNEIINDAKNTNSALMEQYKLIINSYENSRQQRVGLNQTFVFLFSAMAGLYNFLISTSSVIPKTEVSYSMFLISIVVGIFWVNIILQAIKAEKNKYKIIYEIESRMPIRLFSVAYEEKDRANKDKMFNPGYMELALPFFILAILAINFFLFIIHTI